MIGVLCCKQSTHFPFQNWNRSLSSLQGQKLAKLRAILDGGCPDGSVPIRRIRMQDVLRAPSLYLEGKEYAGNVTYAGDSVHPQVDLANHHVSHLLKSPNFERPDRPLFFFSPFW